MKNNKVEFMGFYIDVLTMEETVAFIKERINKGVKVKHMAFNVAKFICALRDSDLKKSIEECDLVTADGEGIVLGVRFLGGYIPERVTGIDLMRQMIREAARDGYSIYLLGGTAEVVKETAEILQKSFPVLNIAGYHHGYYPGGKESEICSQIRDSGANMLFIGMPTPYKEDFMRRYFEKTGALFCMGVGGSFDIVSGKTKRAPVFMQKTGLEWLFRVFQEPGRLWKRYFVSNLLFALILLEKKIKSLWRKDGRLPG